MHTDSVLGVKTALSHSSICSPLGVGFREDTEFFPRTLFSPTAGSYLQVFELSFCFCAVRAPLSSGGIVWRHLLPALVSQKGVYGWPFPYPSEPLRTENYFEAHSVQQPGLLFRLLQGSQLVSTPRQCEALL